MDANETNKTQPERLRQPYEPPRIEESGGFERLVLSCGHTPEEEAAGVPGCSGPAVNS